MLVVIFIFAFKNDGDDDACNTGVKKFILKGTATIKSSKNKEDV